MKKSKKVIALSVVLGLLALCLAGAAAFILYRKVIQSHFISTTYINGQDVTGKSVGDTRDLLEDHYLGRSVQIMENDQAVLSSTLEGIGYTIDEDDLEDKLEEILNSQKDAWYDVLKKDRTYEVEVSYVVDEEKIQGQVTAANLTVARTASADASLQYDGTKYYIEPEVYGNEFDDASLQSAVKDAVNAYISADTQETELTIDIPEDIYKKPAILSDDASLTALLDTYNRYVNAKVTYLFGSESVVLDWQTVQTWLVEAEGSVTLNEQSMRDYIQTMANKYDTIYIKRTFTATDGTEITLDSNDYGYRVDKDGEYTQLLADLESGAPVEREPVYSIKGYARNGREDLTGTYVEVNLTKQHLWFYKNGNLVVETDFVSGLPTEERETTTGAFPVAYKASPYNLKGGGASGWDVNVEYWMPFYDGQGLHDASWRSSFGGNIYQTDGSHGCINLPSDAAKKIYESMEAGIPVLLYK